MADDKKSNRFVLDDATGITIGGKPLEQFVADNKHLLDKEDKKKDAGKEDSTKK